MKKLFCLLLVIFAAVFFGCMSDGSNTITLPGRDPDTWETVILPEKESKSKSKGNVPSSVIPNSIRTELGNSMPINSGTNPPSVSGQYKVSNLELNSSGEGGSGTGNPSELLLDFSKGEKGECLLSYQERSSNGTLLSSKNNVKVNLVGNGNDFTAYFTNDKGQSVVLSGTFTSNNGGISDLYYAIVSPNDKSCSCDTYRSFSGAAELDEWREPEPGKIPQTVIPPGVRNDIEKSGMIIYSGTKPPDISGQYLSDSYTLIGSSISEDKLNKKYADMYIAFVKGSNGTLSYREEQSGDQAGSDNVRVEVVGSGNNFTAYLEVTGESKGIWNRTSTVISGTLTKDGIKDFNYAFVMLEKDSDPNNKLMPLNSYRVFKEGDGLAKKYEWLVSSSSSMRKSSSSVQSSSSKVSSSSSAISSSSSQKSSSSSSLSSSSSEYKGGSCYVDDYGETDDIGDQVWMAKNWSCYAPGSKCYDDDPDNCDIYGRLYTWETAKTICPDGWHLPDNDEWQELVDSAGGDEAGISLKAADNYNGWDDYGNGEDYYGFAALPGGSYSGRDFSDVGKYGYWWSSENRTRWKMSYDNDEIQKEENKRGVLSSVRCLKDKNPEP